MDFLPGHAAMTLAGCDLANVIVLRSPSKFFGLAGARSGVAWSRQPLRAQWQRSANQLAGLRVRGDRADHSPGRYLVGGCSTPVPGRRRRVA